MGFNFGKSFGFGGTPFGPLKAFGGGGGGGGNLRRIFEQMQRSNAFANTQAQGYGLQGLRAIQGGYDSAIGNVDRSGLASKMGIEQSGQQANADIGQSFAGRGLYNTTAYDAARSASMGSTARSLASVDQAIASAKGGLQIGKGQAMAGAYGGLGSLAERNGMNEQELGKLLFGFQANQPTQYDELMRLFQAGGQLLPLAFM